LQESKELALVTDMSTTIIFCEDVNDPEGPVCLPDGSWVITEMGRGIITHISADGKTRRKVAHTGRPNGLALDTNGDLWVAESKFPSLLRMDLSGAVTSLIKDCADLSFLWPNDICFGPDGAIYMTDSGVFLDDFEHIKPPKTAYDVSIDGRVFKIEPFNGECQVLDRGLRFANGIALAPGGKTLFVSETLTGNIYSYTLDGSEFHNGRQYFGNVMIKPPVQHRQVAGPDGMAFDVDGNLYVAVLAQGDITVLSPDGSIKTRYDIDGTFPTNVAFDRDVRNRILITEGSTNRLLMMELPSEGMPLYY